MRNPFIKQESNGAWIAAFALSAISVGTATYLYFKRRKELAAAEKERKEHAGDYLIVPKKKKHKTDLHELHTLAGN